MADISKIKPSNGTVYNIKDTTARNGLTNRPTSFVGTRSEWNALPVATQVKYSLVNLIGEGVYKNNGTGLDNIADVGMPNSYPASQVMLSDGVTSVEDALDDLTEGSSDTLSDATYLYNNAKITKKGNVVMIQWNGFKGLTKQTTSTISGLIPQKYRPLVDIIFDVCSPYTAATFEIYRIWIRTNGNVAVYPYNGVSAQNNLNTTITYLI